MLFSQYGVPRPHNTVYITVTLQSLPFTAFLFSSLSYFTWYCEFLGWQRFYVAQHTGNPFLTWVPELTTWWLTRFMSSALARWLNDKGCKKYTWVCTSIPYCFCNCCFSVSVFSHRPEIQMQISPAVGQILLAFHKQLHSYSQNGKGCVWMVWLWKGQFFQED